jgi:hypothetical protein
MPTNQNLTTPVSSVESKLGNVIFKEKIDMVVLTKLIKSNLLQEYPAEWINEHTLPYKVEEEHLVKIRSSTKNSYLSVKYNRAKHGIGRFYPNKSVSLGALRRQIRHTIAVDDYVDIDIVNAHPVLLVQLCEANGIKCDKLADYVNNRAKYLQQVANEYGINERDKQKNLFIRLLYFGSFNQWAKDNQIIDPVPTDDIVLLINELKRIGEWLVDKHKHLKKTLCSMKDCNVMARITSYVLQEHERRILECVYDYLTLNQAIPEDNAVLCFDGIMILKPFYKEQMLEELSEYVEQKTGFNVEFVQKEMNEGYRHLLEGHSPSDHVFNFEPQYLVRFDSKFCNSLGTYEEKKAYVENFICKILLPTGMYIWTENIEMIDDFNNFTNKHLRIIIKSQAELTNDLKHIGSGQFTSKDREIRFTEVWFEDINIRLYNSVDFIPMNSVFSKNDHHLKNTFNLFLGYNPEISTPYCVEKEKSIVTPWLDIVRELCEGDQKCADFYIKLLAHKLKYPHKKLPYAVILRGDQGTGKTIHLNAIANIIRKEHFISSSNPNDFFGNHAEGFHKKLIVNMNECEGKSTFDFEGKIKSAISEDRLVLDAKNQRPVEIGNYIFLIITTNKDNPVPIDVRTGDRRFIVFKSTKKYLDSKYHKGGFWKKFAEHINKPEFIAALYNYLMKIDVDNVDWSNERKRVLTPSYYEMARQFVPSTVLFLEHFITSKKFIQHDDEFASPEEYKKFYEKPISEFREWEQPLSIVGTEFYNDYVEWCRKFGFKKEYEPTIKKFYPSLKNEDIGVDTKTGHSNATHVVFTPSTVYQAMIDKKYIAVEGVVKPDEIEEKVDESMFDEMFDI